MLNFSSETITFPFVENNHLKTTLALANDSSKHVYYKFRVSKPKSYLVKPNQGYIKPNSSQSIVFTLQKEDVTESLGHKFMLMYVGSDSPRVENYDQMFVGDYETKKFPIKITGLLSEQIIGEVIDEVGQQIFKSVKQSIAQIKISPSELLKEVNQELKIKSQRQKEYNQKQQTQQTFSSKKLQSKFKVPAFSLTVSLVLGLLVGYFIVPLVQS